VAREPSFVVGDFGRHNVRIEVRDGVLVAVLRGEMSFMLFENRHSEIVYDCKMVRSEVLKVKCGEA
jgi:hypothetical protein